VSGFLFPEFIDSLLDHLSALDAGGKKAEAEGRRHKLVEESEHFVPVLGAATPSRAPQVVKMRTSGASLALGTGVDLGSANNISKRRRGGASDSGLRPDFLYNNSRSEGRSEGTQTYPRILGNFEVRHLLVQTSLLDNCQKLERTCILPQWTEQFAKWTETLRGRGDTKLELKRNNKDRCYGAHLVFYALPTDLSPTVDSSKVLAWNKWDPALPLLFFQTAKSILTDDGVLTLLYADTFENVHDVAKGLYEVDVFEPFKNWTVRLDRPLFYVHQLCEVRLPLVC
jgi:hypothetical protein